MSAGAGKDVLVAGIGNVFHGDDGFGIEVVRRLAARTLPPTVRVVDFGIRGFDLAYALSSGLSAAILVDATKRGGAPGTLYVLEPSELTPHMGLDTHAMHPLRALELARQLGQVPEMLRVVACEAKTLGDDDGVMGLSVEVADAVDRAVLLVEEIVLAIARRADA